MLNKGKNADHEKGAVKKAPNKKDCDLAKKSKTAVFFCGIIKVP